MVLRDGERIAEVNTTTYDVSQPGEYQVIGVSDGDSITVSRNGYVKNGITISETSQSTHIGHGFRHKRVKYKPVFFKFDAEQHYYGMYLYGRDNLIMNPRAETLGESLAILWDVASPERAAKITESNPTTPFGAGLRSASTWDSSARASL